MTDKPHYAETPYGFEYGALSVERCWSHNGAVCVRIRSVPTGKFVDVQVTPAGRKLYVSTGNGIEPGYRVGITALGAQK